MNRNFWYILGIGTILIFISIFLMQSASAYIVPPANETILSIGQGDTVYLNHWYDIRGVVDWPVQELAYFKQGYCYGDPDKIVDVSSFQAKFYIDPELFIKGTWFKWGTQTCEPAEYQIAFSVKEKPIQTTLTIENATVGISKNETIIPAIVPLSQIPVHHIADILVARGDPVSFSNESVQSGSHFWILGRESIKEYENLLNVPVDNGAINIPIKDIQNLNPYVYTILIDNPGKNTLVEAEYNPENSEVKSPFYKTPKINAEGYSGTVLLDKLIPWFAQYSDDPIIVLKMSVQDPVVEIRTIDVMWVGNQSVLDVQAYTNVAAETQAMAYVDYNADDLSANRKPYYTYVSGTEPGDMRYIRIKVPIDYDNLNPGEHTITIIVPQDKAFSTVTFHVYSLPEGQERPLEYIQYIGGDEFKPIVTVTVPVPGPTRIVTQVVTVQLTPDYDTLAKAQNDKWWITFIQTAETVLMYGFAILAIGSFIAYIGWVYFRGKKGKEMY